MVMIEDVKNGLVLVQKRRLSWKGISFPGGHIEPGESFYSSAIREVKEETGLNIKNLSPCGTVDWFNTDTGERYIVFLYKTCDFSGETITETEEGEVFWVKKDELRSLECSVHFDKYLDIFLDDRLSEAFACHNSEHEDELHFE